MTPQDPSIVRIMVASVLCGALVLLGLVLLLLTVGSPGAGERHHTREVLDRLLNEGADRHRVEVVLSPGAALTKEDAKRVARMMADDKPSTLAKIDRYPATNHHCVGASVTCFVFYDDQGKMVDYELGEQ